MNRLHIYIHWDRTNVYQQRKRGELESDEEEEEAGEKPEKGSDEESSSEESSEEEEEVKVHKPKGLQGVIEFSNPNHQVKTTKKASEIDMSSKAKQPELTRRQK